MIVKRIGAGGPVHQLQVASKSTGQRPWIRYADAAGINRQVDLGIVKCHILHYVDRYSIQGSRINMNPDVWLCTKKLAKNLARKQKESGIPFGCSERTVRQLIKELIEDGYLLVVDRTPKGNSVVRAAWDLRCATMDPLAVWQIAFANQRARERRSTRRRDSDTGHEPTADDLADNQSRREA